MTFAPPDPATVRALAAAAEQADGVAPLSEAFVLALTDPEVSHVGQERDGTLVGYAQVDRTGATNSSSTPTTDAKASAPPCGAQWPTPAPRPCGRTATCPRRAPWPGGSASTGSASCTAWSAP